MENVLDQIMTAITLYLPSILLAIVILIVGWLVALALSALTRNLLARTNLDNRLVTSLRGDPSVKPESIRVEHWIGTAVFWLIMIITLAAFFQALNIPAISGPINNFLDDVIAFIPGLIGAIVLIAIAWLLATIVRAIVVRVLNASGITRRLTENADVQPRDRISVAQTIGNVVYWLIFLLFLPAILDALDLGGLLLPVQGLVDDILSYLPNLIGAGLILIVGWLVARIVRQIVTNLLAGIGVDNLMARAGVAGSMGQVRLSNVIGTIVYILILIPVAIAALNALNIPAVSQPAAAMLTDLLNALPAIFGAFLLLAVAYFVARLVGQFVAGILANLGFNQLFNWLGIYREPAEIRAVDLNQPSTGVTPPSGTPAAALRRTTPSDVVGYLVTVAIMLFAAMEAAGLLGFETLNALVARFVVAGGQVLVGLIVFALGLYLANLADRVIRASGHEQRSLLATAARVAIIIFAAALALREMGIAESIVNLAFGLLLGAVAVAAALAFGLGGREAAAKQLERWRQQVQEQREPPMPPSTGPAIPPASPTTPPSVPPGPVITGD